MARAYGSSLHIPVKIDGKAGTINFWSTENDAFPPEAREPAERSGAGNGGIGRPYWLLPIYSLSNRFKTPTPALPLLAPGSRIGNCSGS